MANPNPEQSYAIWADIRRDATLRNAEVVIAFGAYGEQLAATRTNRRGNPQCRVWRPSSKTWTKWRILSQGEILRYATPEDRQHFKPRYGIEWDRD